MVNLVFHDFFEGTGATTEFTQKGTGVNRIVDQVLIHFDAIVVLVNKIGKILERVVAAADIVVYRNDGVSNHASTGKVAVGDDDIARAKVPELSQHLIHKEICGVEVAKHSNFHLSSLLSN